jgi:hypothetical protein
MKSDTGSGEAVVVLESIGVRLKCRHLSQVVAGLVLAPRLFLTRAESFRGRRGIQNFPRRHRCRP